MQPLRNSLLKDDHLNGSRRACRGIYVAVPAQPPTPLHPMFLSALLRVIPSSVLLVVCSTLQKMMRDERFHDGECVCMWMCMPRTLYLVLWLSFPDSYLDSLLIIKSPTGLPPKGLSPTQARLSVQVRLCACSMFDTHLHQCLPVLGPFLLEACMWGLPPPQLWYCCRQLHEHWNSVRCTYHVCHRCLNSDRRTVCTLLCSSYVEIYYGILLLAGKTEVGSGGRLIVGQISTTSFP